MKNKLNKLFQIIKVIVGCYCDIIYPVIFYQIEKIVTVMDDISKYHLLYQDLQRWAGLFLLSRIQIMSPNLPVRHWRHSLQTVNIFWKQEQTMITSLIVGQCWNHYLKELVVHNTVPIIDYEQQQ